jgi:hypothetical protein
MRQRLSSKRTAPVTLVREFAPDMDRQVQALLVVLRAHEGDPGTAAQHPSAPADSAPVPRRSNAPPPDEGEAPPNDQD